jgi:hypothetical protein
VNRDYNIVTYCSANYKSALDFCLDSWFTTKVNRVYCYTDTLTLSYRQIHQYQGRLRLLKLGLPASEDWVENIGRKPDAVARYLSLHLPEPLFCFLDVDCLVLRDLSPAFSEMPPHDIGVTRLLGLPPGVTINCGAWYGQNNEAVRNFVTAWCALSKQYRKNRRMHQPNLPAYEQYAFDTILRQAYCHKKSLRVQPLAPVWNSENSNLKEWCHTIRQAVPYVLHFKGGRWQRPDELAQVLQAAQPKEPTS